MDVDKQIAALHIVQKMEFTMGFRKAQNKF